MNGIFHYSVTYFLALRAGFNPYDAYILAYSANYVDHNLVPLIIQLPNGRPYHTMPTHHFGFWDKSQEETVWMPFHFFPSGDYSGNGSIRGDSNAKASGEVGLNTLPSSDPVKELLIQALKTRNLYRVGIALHTYADSWAHQEFTGKRQGWNTLESLSPVPPIGHAQAGRAPDSFHGLWLDPRLQPQEQVVSNRPRFLEAARKIYRYLATYNHRNLADTDLVMMELEQVLGDQGFTGNPADYYLDKLDRMNTKNPYTLQRLVGIAAKSIGLKKPLPPAVHAGKDDKTLELDLAIAFDIPPYHRQDWKYQAINLPAESPIDDEKQGLNDKYLWLKHEFTVKNKLLEPQSVPARHDFESSHYYRWMEAAKEQYAAANQILKNL